MELQTRLTILLNTIESQAKLEPIFFYSASKIKIASLSSKCLFVEVSKLNYIYLVKQILPSPCKRNTCN